MYYLGVKSDFSSAHYLRDYEGKCKNLHGHNWIVEAVFRSHSLDEKYMCVDFGILKSLLREILSEMDHVLLNDIDEFKEKNPTAEVISRYIYERISGEISELNIDIYEVKVWESLNSWVKWIDD